MNIAIGDFARPFTAWRPDDGRIFEFFSYDTETTEIDDDQHNLTPAYVLGAACDGQRGVFISRENLLPFFQAHQDVPRICHNASFDLKVTDFVLKSKLDLYRAVEKNQVWDTQILKRLYSLATVGHTARGESGLASCAQAHLGVTLQKDQRDAQGEKIRTSFGQFLGQPPSTIPAQYLTYLGQDVIATWQLFWDLYHRIRALLQRADRVYGYAGPGWLKEVTSRFGPLTHHIQLRASIVMDVLRFNGIGVDQHRQGEKAEKVQLLLKECKERMRLRGFLAGEQGSDKAMQSILSQLKRKKPDLELRKTPSGKWSTDEENLAELATEDSFFADYRTYKIAEKLLSTYLRKMGRPRLNPRFGYLLETGRTYCGGGFNLQNLPKETSLLEQDPEATTIRGCFVPGEGKVFLDCDYSQIELVVLAHVWETQFGRRSRLADLIRDNHDVHRLIAAAVLGKDSQTVTKEERNSAKPVSFGRPGGMGAQRLQGIAKTNYGVELGLEQVEQRIEAYEKLCPELRGHLQDEVDLGAVLAQALALTVTDYEQARGILRPAAPATDPHPSWLGWMLLKVLREQNPVTREGRPYEQVEIDYFWKNAQALAVPLKPSLQVKLERHQADFGLWNAVRDWAGRRSVFTITGRLRAHTTFCSARNCLFQGPAADGAILGLWLIWRKGYKIVDFVHDQVVVESPADAQIKERVSDIESLMKQGMAMVIPGMPVKVESVVTASLNKKHLDPRYDPKTWELLDASRMPDRRGDDRSGSVTMDLPAHGHAESIPV